MNMHYDLPHKLTCDSIESRSGRAGALQTGSEFILESCDMFEENFRPGIGSIARGPTTVSRRLPRSA